MRKTVVVSMVLIAGLFLCSPAGVSAFNQQDLQKLNTTNKCSKCDLSQANLEGIDFYGANLSGANLTGANLKGTLFNDANLTGANLKGASTDKETSFIGAKLSEATWMDGSKCKSGQIGRCK
jgi:uncharacterized protein YjbI with pentapeptide repeats